MSTNKNPYEVRLDVLKMAQEMLDREMEINMSKYNSSITATMQNNIGSVYSAIEASPKMYSSEDVITKANALYEFVACDTRSRSK